MKIVPAAGMSSPFSTIVVATSTSISPRAKASTTCSRSRDGIWPFRVPHEPLDLQEIAERALDGEARLDINALGSRTLLELSWDSHRWELWVMTLPSGILLYCDSDGDETRVLASARRGNPAEADGFFLERLAQSRGIARRRRSRCSNWLDERCTNWKKNPFSPL